MAIYHLNAKIISRGKSQSAIAAAAYRSGERLRDEQANEQKYYTSRAERIQFTDIMAPADAPEWAHDRNALWNHAERAEKRKDAQLAREFEISLPHELTEEQREWLVKDFAREAFVRRGYVVDIAIHAPDKDSDKRNHHAHLMVTMRELGAEGFARTKDRSLNSDAQLGQWREQWAHLANRHLARHGHEERIDHRSLKEQGVDREATVHLGYAASAMAQRGAQSDRMDQLRAILDRNEIRIDLKAIGAELGALEKEQAEQQRQAAERAEATRLAAEQAGKVAAPVPIEDIQARHAAAEAERTRAEAMKQLEAGARADERKLRQPDSPERAFGDNSREAAQQLGRELREEAAQARQDKWRESVEARDPDKIKPIDAGFRVVDKATGAVFGLGAFVSNLLAGSPPAAPRADTEKFTMDPAVRKQQQLARLAERQQVMQADLALVRIQEDIDKGRALSADDIKGLTRQHQEQIRHFGDDAVRQMVEEARKRDERYWKGQERERE